MRTPQHPHQIYLIPLLAVAAGLSFPGCAGGAPPPLQPAAPPIVTVPAGATSLDELGLYNVHYRYFDGRAGSMPPGWTGHFAETTGISCTPFGSQDGKSAFLIHPPWRGGTGVTDQEFLLSLPPARRISLSFSIAMKEGEVGPGKSDGATFRLFLDGAKKMEETKTDARWSPHSFDLTSHAGHRIRLTFETDPGPHRDPSFDFALWGDRTLTVEGGGRPLSQPPFAPEAPLGTLRSAWGGASPECVSATMPGPRVRDRLTGPADMLGDWSHSVSLPGDKTRAPRTVPLGIGQGSYLDLVAPDGKLVRSDSPEVHSSLSGGPDPGGQYVNRIVRYQLGARNITVKLRLYHPRGGCVRVDLSSDDPYIAAVHFGGIGPVAFRRQVIVPYLGSIWYLPELGLFSNVFIDYTTSQASALDGADARYEPRTSGQRNPVRETAYFALSPDVHAVLPTPPNPPSPYRALLGNRVVLDVWGGKFTDNAAWLKGLASYGLTNLLTIVHDWQNGGYDNKLPNVLPANPNLGGDAGMKQWAAAAASLGEPFALHENYVDFYPNAAVYNANDVARDSAGHFIPAWKNLIQSYALAPTAILKYARMFTPDVHARFGTTASYLDVHSAVPPWFHVDFRAEVPGSARFHTVWEAHRDLWRLFRAVHHGPVLGEGANHWYWSGLLDGVEAQFGAGIPGSGGETAPLFVDFDLLKIHPRQFNHGMGYLERWLRTGYEGDWGSRIPSMQTLDQYRMQEVAYGHAGFIAAPLVHSIPFIWQEHNLMLPITRRYAAAVPTSIRYNVNGKLMETSAAIARGAALDRVRITYSGGLTVWANGSASPWTIGSGASSIVLPQFGWLARGAGATCYTALRDGIVVDYAETPQSLFANARSTVVESPQPLNVSPSVSDFQQTGPRRFRITYRWTVGERIPAGSAIFIHVTGAGATQPEGIVFQPSSGIAIAPENWPVGVVTGQPVDVTLPDGLKDGDYALNTGLWLPEGGSRLKILGKQNGSDRIQIGTITVTDDGKTITFQKAAPVPAQRTSLSTQHTNPGRREVNFGKIITSGSVRMDRVKPGAWTLTPFPRDRPFSVLLNLPALDRALSPVHVTALDPEGHNLGTVPAAPVPGRPKGWVGIVVNGIHGAVKYRMTGG